MKLSILLPARNERDAIAATVDALEHRLTGAAIPHEILAIDDHSTDGTAAVLASLSQRIPSFRWIANEGPPGYGYTLRAGLDAYTGDAVCIVMADASDDPDDVIAYYRKLEEGYECVFGSRFIHGARVTNYPWLKLTLNRAANVSIALLFGSRYTDWTNAFKAFRREVIDGLHPILACHFNLTVELPLKAVARGYSYAVVPIKWYGRTTGVSKLRLKEMGSRYVFVVLYVLIEKWLSRGDYRRTRRARSVGAGS